LRYIGATLAAFVFAAVLSCSGEGTGISGRGGDDATDPRRAGNTPDRESMSATSDTAGAARLWPAWPDSALSEELSYGRLTCRTIVYAAPEDVWRRITTVGSFVLWYPPWKDERDFTRSLNGVGGTLSYRTGSVSGRSVVTWYDPLRELRIVHEPADGGFGGALRFRLERVDRGVGLEVTEIVPSSGVDALRAEELLCKRTALIKRLAEGE